jgi:dipeptidyl-peptidase-3
MKKLAAYGVLIGLSLVACEPSTPEENPKNQETMHSNSESSDFKWETEQFADLRILRYQVPGWEKLSLKQKKLAYYLNMAGLSGRDIIWDQLYRHNLEIRKALEQIIRTEKSQEGADWDNFMVYAKRVFFSNGIHHHYSHAKLEADFSEVYLRELLSSSGAKLNNEAIAVIFNDADNKGVSKDPDTDLVLASAVNFYDADISEKEVSDFYNAKKIAGDTTPVSYGLNSKLVRENGEIVEKKWHEEGMYGAAIKKITHYLSLAQENAENAQQGKALGLLIEYYRTGDLKTWDDYNIAWVADTGSTVDYINSFIEVYHDPLGYKGTYETVVQVKDLDASQKMAVISENIQYFEDNSTILPEHKKEKVVGVSYRMINVVGEAGATTPATPIGVNLPNANWIREAHGSKSISLTNIESAYESAKGAGFLEEFTFTTEEMERAKKYAAVTGKMHTALHEVVGHASGKLEPGIATPKETLKNYSSTLEEARADLVALYFIMDQKMLDLGLLESLEAGKAEYDGYIRNGLMLQLRKLKPGEEIEEDHMRNRQLIASWALETGAEENVIEKKVLNGKTYFVINDYEKLKEIFGMQLREIQRIKSKGDYKAGKSLVETYGVKVDQAIHQEVLDRTADLNIAPYSGFIQPQMEVIMDGDSVADVKLIFPEDFIGQMLYYGENHSHL